MVQAFLCRLSYPQVSCAPSLTPSLGCLSCPVSPTSHPVSCPSLVLSLAPFLTYSLDYALTPSLGHLSCPVLPKALSLRLSCPISCPVSHLSLSPISLAHLFPTPSITLT